MTTTDAPTAFEADQLLTGEQVADRLGISRQRVQQLAGRPDFPQPVGRVGRATVWRTGDVDDYARGTRTFVAVNGITVGLDQARELAVRLHRQRETFPRASDEVAARLDVLLDSGGALSATGEHALAVFAALQTWLEQTNVDVLGPQLLSLRYRVYGDAQDAGLIPHT